MKAAETFFIGFFIAIVAGIIFVQAGKGGGESGGQQTSSILTSAGSALTNIGAGLETGSRTG